MQRQGAWEQAWDDRLRETISCTERGMDQQPVTA